MTAGSGIASRRNSRSASGAWDQRKDPWFPARRPAGFHPSCGCGADRFLKKATLGTGSRIFVAAGVFVHQSDFERHAAVDQRSEFLLASDFPLCAHQRTALVCYLFLYEFCRESDRAGGGSGTVEGTNLRV